MPFVHLNLHSCYSLLAGTVTPERIPALVRQLGMNAAALTDSNGLYAAVAFQEACRREGVRPIFGVELTRPRFLEDNAGDGPRPGRGGFGRERPAGPGESDHRATLLVRNEAGYRLLGEIISDRHLDDSFSLEDALGRALASENIHVLCSAPQLLRGLASRRSPFLHAELRAGLDTDSLRRLRETLRCASNEDIAPVATTGAFFADAAGREIHEILGAARHNTRVDNLPSGAAAPREAMLVDEERMLSLLLPAVGRAVAREAIAATTKIADDCRMQIPTGTPRPPHFNIGKGAASPDSFLYRLAHDGLRERLGIAPGDRDARARRGLAALRRELHVIRRRDVSSYFLIAWDLVRHGRSRGLESLGRGSAAGSLVSFALHITHVNPLDHGLYFERFLNLERDGLPDFDIDFGSSAREEILDYIFQRYGADRVAMVGAWQTFRPRGAFRTLIKALGLPMDRFTALLRALPAWGGCENLRARLREDPRSRRLDLSGAEMDRLFSLAEKLGGLPRLLGTHPCGMVVTPGPIRHFVPLQRGARGLAITQWDMLGLEAAGLIKMDILGQRGLSVIDRCRNRVRENYGQTPAIADNSGLRRSPDGAMDPFCDPATLSLLRQGRTRGCFYIESPIMMQIIRQARCADFETLTALSSIIRPGVSNHGGKRTYLLRHLGLQPLGFLHARLEPLLRDTHGVLIYQEQVMRVLQALGGLSLGEADHFRKIMSGKDREGHRIEEMGERWLRGATDLFVSDGDEPEEAARIAREIFVQIAAFVGYAFCKAHSASFARESFVSAFWKARYPAEFMASVIEERGGYYTTADYVDEARLLGLQVLPPHVNAATVECRGWSEGASAADPATGQAGGKARLRIGLSFIKGLKRRSGKWIADESARRAFLSLDDFIMRVRLGCEDAPSRAETAILARLGCFDGLAPPEPLDALDVLWPGGTQSQIEKKATAPLRSVNTEALEWLGFTVAVHPLQAVANYPLALGRRVSGAKLRQMAAETPLSPDERDLGEVTLVGVRVTLKRMRSRRDGRMMAFATFSDETGPFEVVLFPDAYARLAPVLGGSGPFRITGTLRVDLREPLIEGRMIKRLSPSDFSRAARKTAPRSAWG